MIKIYHIDGSRHLHPYMSSNFDVMSQIRYFAFPDASNGYYFECVVYDDKSKFMVFLFDLLHSTMHTHTTIDAEIK